VYLGFFDKHGCTYWRIKKNLTHCKHVPCNTLPHSTNEDLLNIKSRTLSRTSDTTETQNLCVIKVILRARWHSHNMKPARPWMLAHLKIIWQFHAHPMHQKVSRFSGPRFIGDDFLLGPNLVSLSCRSFIRVIVPYEISTVNFRVETKILVRRDLIN
jgi:hypothetical protein